MRIYALHEVETCGCCDLYHPRGFSGDCRDDENRLVLYGEDDNLISYADQRCYSARPGTSVPTNYMRGCEPREER
jgi:hypothetical protein